MYQKHHKFALKLYAKYKSVQQKSTSKPKLSLGFDVLNGFRF